MGIVFVAEDTRLNREVAVKVLPPAVAVVQGFRERFLREARAAAAAAATGDHIVAIHDVSEQNGVPYLVMELLAGETLEARLKREAPMPLPDVFRVGREVATGLAGAHARGLIHRDVKPANVWLQAPSGRVKLLDFGLAYEVAAAKNLTQTGVILGTPAYMAPEQADGARVDARADLFSLGCILYEMTTGQSPFSGPSAMSILKAVALHEPPPPSQLISDVPPAFEALVKRLMAKRSDDRPASAADVVEALRRIEAGDTTISGRAPPPVVHTGRRTPWLLAGVAALGLVTAVLVSGWLWRKDHQAATVPGAPPPDIVFGMSGPFSGPARELGRDLEAGIQTCFHQVNDAGGIGGWHLKLVALDDGYDPDRALANMHELFDKHRAAGVVGNVGTPTGQKVLPYVVDHDLLFFGAFTGAKFLRRNPPDRLVFNYRASYDEETAALVKYLLDVRKIAPEALAVFAQQDAYGDAGFEGVARTFRQRGLDPDKTLRVGYVRNSLDVTAAVDGVLARPGIRAVVMVPTYQPAARFIQRVKSARPDMIFGNVSFVGSTALAEELRELTGGVTTGEGVIVTQVVPPVSSNSAAVSHYRDLAKRYFPSQRPSFVSLEGFIAASILVEGLRRAGPTAKTDELVAALESIKDLDLGIGTHLGFAPSEHQASHKVWGTVIDAEGGLKEIELD
jgi:ABC-type branched-subunit amino acid transport system substrate-binding protein